MQSKADANSKKDIILWGATGQARVLRECLSYYGYKVIALFDNNEEVSSPFADIPLFYKKTGFEKWASSAKLLQGDIKCLVAIGGARGKQRHKIQRFLEDYGVQPISVIHPTAFCAKGANIGKGSQVLAQAAICVDVKIGEACIVNTAASVDHESVLENGVHICPGAHLAGAVRVGEYSMIGAGAVVLPRITVGKHAIVGAGAVVTKDVADNSIVYGNPACFIRENIDIG